MHNIILIGMPGVGKSTIGVVLAKVLGYEFLDSDLVIQNKYHKRLSELIEQYGTDGFLSIENETNASLVVDRSIIATGGSAVYGKEAMEHFKSMGTIVYLKVGYDTLVERLGDLTNRGVAMKNGTTLEELFEERTPLYEHYADIVVDEDHLSIRETIDCLLAKGVE